MSYGKLITRFTSDGHAIFITIPSCRSAGNYYMFYSKNNVLLYLNDLNRINFQNVLPICS